VHTFLKPLWFSLLDRIDNGRREAKFKRRLNQLSALQLTARDFLCSCVRPPEMVEGFS